MNSIRTVFFWIASLTDVEPGGEVGAEDLGDGGHVQPGEGRYVDLSQDLLDFLFLSTVTKTICISFK